MAFLRKVLKIMGLTLAGILGILVLLLAFWYLRPNSAKINPQLKMQTWDAVADRWHNSNTDMIYWQDAFYMVYASSPYHFASDQSRLHIDRSADGRTWQPVAQFDASGQDIRDPKFGAIGGKLILYALKNVDFAAEQYQTVYATSADGSSWTEFQEVNQKG